MVTMFNDLQSGELETKLQLKGHNLNPLQL